MLYIQIIPQSTFLGMKIFYTFALIFFIGQALAQTARSDLKHNVGKIRNHHVNMQLESLPFVPEEYRDGTNIQFDANHFRDTISLQDPQNANLKNAINEIIANNTIPRGPGAQFFQDVEFEFFGRGGFMDNGRRARLAVSYEALSCSPDQICNTFICYMELTETFSDTPWKIGDEIDSKREGLEVVGWTCTRRDLWCHICETLENRNSVSNDSLPLCSETPSQNATLLKQSCSRRFGALTPNQKYVCVVEFSQMAGLLTEIKHRTCKVVIRDETPKIDLACDSTDSNRTNICICEKSGCNDNVTIERRLADIVNDLKHDTVKMVQNFIIQLKQEIENYISKLLSKETNKK